MVSLCFFFWHKVCLYIYHIIILAITITITFQLSTCMIFHHLPQPFIFLVSSFLVNKFHFLFHSIFLHINMFSLYPLITNKLKNFNEKFFSRLHFCFYLCSPLLEAPLSLSLSLSLSNILLLISNFILYFNTFHFTYYFLYM